MKRLILFIGLILLSVLSFSQRPTNLASGVKIGKLVSGTGIITVDSITQFSTGDFRLWKGGVQLSPNLKAGFKIGSDAVPSTLTADEIGKLDSIKTDQPIQRQIDKKASLTGTETLTNKTLISTKINENVVLTPTSTELNHVDGVTSPIQGQINARRDSTTSDAIYFKKSLAVLTYTGTQLDSIIQAKVDSLGTLSRATYGRIAMFTNTKVAHTGNTAETVFYTGTVPANSIGVNGFYEIIMTVYSDNNTANAKTLTVKLGGSTLIQMGVANARSAQYRYYLYNDGSLTSQIGMPNASAGWGWGVSTSAISTFTLNTATNLSLTLSATLATDTENLGIENVYVIAH